MDKVISFLKYPADTKKRPPPQRDGRIPKTL